MKGHGDQSQTVPSPILVSVESTRRPSAFVVSYGARTFILPIGVSIIGRVPDADITIGASSVSRRHAAVHVDDVHVCIEDLGSKSGTFVDECRVDSPTEITQGSDIRVGKIRVSLRFVKATT